MISATDFESGLKGTCLTETKESKAIYTFKVTFFEMTLYLKIITSEVIETKNI